VNYSIYGKEQIIAGGQAIYLELAPVDPRSLMQGDYMALRFKALDDAFGRRPAAGIADGRLVLGIDGSGIATYRRLDDRSPLAADEVALRYRVRGGQPRLSTDAWFFEEGRAAEYAGARYGEFRVDAKGGAILTHLRDGKLAVLGGAPSTR
jgi:uncharacterized membrane-anchored protein